MIQYDPHHWRSHLFDIKGSMLREIFSRVAVCVAWSLIVVAWHQAGQSKPVLSRTPEGTLHFEPSNGFVEAAREIPIAIPLTGHTLVGFVLSLLLVFRTNASYDRFWEGRRQWGNIVNDSRNLARLASSLLKDNATSLNSLLRWTAAYPWSVMNRLRDKKELGADTSELPPADVITVEQAQHIPFAVSCQMTDIIDSAKRRGLISDIQQQMLDNCVQRLIDSLGACERIHNTPLPFAYMVHLRRAMIVYLATLPMGLVTEMGWMTVPATLLIAYVMLGVEEIGVEIEDPFGYDHNNLPLKSLCETIGYDLGDLTPHSNS